jgi:rhamnosyl/mannosyltransferase
MLKGHKRLDQLIGIYEREILPRVFSRARVLVPVSPVSLASGRPHATQITPGVDMGQFTPGLTPSTRPRTVLYLGRIDRTSAWKGVHVLVRAFAELDDLPDARLRLVGGGDAVPDQAKLAAQLDIGDRIEFAGELTGQDLAGAIRAAAVLVLPSLSEAECHPMALIEAMACGTPVVGSEIGGIPYIIQPDVTGLLVPPGDVPALAAACRRILVDGALADRLGAAGRRRAVERYAWPTLTDRYLEIFRSLS